VAKYATADQVIELAWAGQRLFGENRIQEAIPKMGTVSLAVHDPLRWHMIGHLQRNKVRQAVGPFELIESVDSVRLAQAISAQAAEDDLEARVLLEVNVAGDPAKYGFIADEVRAQHAALRSLPALRVDGLMTIGPADLSPEAMRTTYGSLRSLRDELNVDGRFPPLRHLSMGMSADFEVAIEEGATIVRVGTALFGAHHH
jgi:pyridoxal phosphate enzyme (YggS family)